MTATDTNPKQKDINLKHTVHSAIRASQRGVRYSDIVFVVQNAKPIYKQNLCFYSLKTAKYKADIRANLKNLVVVISHDDQVIITVYKSDKAFKKIKKKPKRLC